MKSTKNSILNYLRYSVVSRSLLLLSKRDRIKILIVALIQIFLGFLDLASVIIIGLLGALSISGVQSQGPGTRVKSVLDLLNLSDNSFQYQCAVLGIVAAIFLVIKTILSMFFIKKTLFFLANKASALSSELFSRMLNQNLLQLQVKNSQEKLFAITEGVKLITVNVIGNLILLLSDISLLLVMFFGLIFLDTYVAILTFAGFGILAFILYRTMSVKAQKIGKKNTEVTIKSNELILESFNTYRENVVRNRRYYYWQKVNISRSQLASYQAELAFMPNMSKYILESAMILGSLGLCAIMFLTKDAVHAFATLALFLGAVSRIVPAILRIQQGAVSIKAGIGSAHITIDLIESLSEIPKIKESFDPVDLKYRDFESVVIIKNLSLTYPDQEIKALNEINLRIDAGTSVAVVGPSGAGKTSLVDVILGIIEPSSGTVSISGFNPLEAIAKWPGAIGYVPQNTVISQGSVRSNVTLGYPIGAFSDQLIWDAIEVAQLKDFVLGLPGELEATLGEGGAKISGGQRQRIGIARALITNPKLLILDEATSSLDSQVESSISSSINSLSGRVTVITIAHRLSTVRDSNKVVFIEKGKILSEGSFAKVRGEVPNFDAQAKLMGL